MVLCGSRPVISRRRPGNYGSSEVHVEITPMAHSPLSASVGGMREARRAGSQADRTINTSRNPVAVIANRRGMRASRANRDTNGRAIAAMPQPITAPVTARSAAWRRIIRRMSPSVAPIAIRKPISPCRWLTVYDTRAYTPSTASTTPVNENAPNRPRLKRRGPRAASTYPRIGPAPEIAASSSTALRLLTKGDGKAAGAVAVLIIQN